MLNKLTWKDLLVFLQELESEGKLPDEDVMWHNLETGDESPCDTVFIESSPYSKLYDRLVLATNWDAVKE